MVCSKISGTASGDTTAAGSPVTATSQVCMACSLSRSRTSPAASSWRPKKSSRITASWSSVSASSRLTCCSSQVRLSAAWASGVRLFHASQTGWNASRSSWPFRLSAADRFSVAISAPLPRWDRTWAMVQSRS